MATRLANPIAVPMRRAERYELKRWAIAALGFILLAFLAFVYLRQASAVATAGYDIASLEAEKKQWQAKNEQLRFQIATLRSLDRVEKEAASRLNMTPPQNVVYVAATPSTRTVALSTRSSDRSTASLSGSGAETLSEQNWWDGIASWLPFAQRSLSPAIQK